MKRRESWRDTLDKVAQTAEAVFDKVTSKLLPKTAMKLLQRLYSDLPVILFKRSQMVQGWVAQLVQERGITDPRQAGQFVSQNLRELVWEALESHWQEWDEELVLNQLTQGKGKDLLPILQRFILPAVLPLLDEITPDITKLETAEELDYVITNKMKELMIDADKDQDLANLIKVWSNMKNFYPHVYQRLLNIVLIIMQGISRERKA